MLRLSPTTGLNLFKECPRCFWLHYNKNIHRPRGIFPSLPGGMDLVIKKHFDKYRGKLPPEIDGKVVGQLMPDVELINKWRNWQTGLEYHDKERDAVLFGALDDCLIDNNFYIPLDYKTRGSAPKDGDSEKYYQTQLDCYCLILESSGYKTRGLAYLVYYWPVEVREEGIIRFHVEPMRIETNIESAKNIFSDAVTMLAQEIPHASKDCEYCNLVVAREDE